MRDLTKDYEDITGALHTAILDKFVEPCDTWGCQDENAICEVSAASYDGFIAHTNGGFRTLVYCDLSAVESEGMSDFETAQLQQYIDSSHEDSAKWFIEARDCLNDLFEDSGEDSASAWLYGRWDKAENEYTNNPQLEFWTRPQWWQTDMAHEREDFYDYDSEYLSEGGTFFYEITALFYEKGHRRNITGEDEIFIFAGINTDFGYGREKGLECAFENTYKLARLTAKRLEVIVEHCADKIIH